MTLKLFLASLVTLCLAGCVKSPGYLFSHNGSSEDTDVAQATKPDALKILELCEAYQAESKPFYLPQGELDATSSDISYNIQMVIHDLICQSNGQQLFEQPIYVEPVINSTDQFIQNILINEANRVGLTLVNTPVSPYKNVHLSSELHRTKSALTLMVKVISYDKSQVLAGTIRQILPIENANKQGINLMKLVD